MAPPNTTDTTYLDTQLDAMIVQLVALATMQPSAQPLTDGLSSLPPDLLFALVESLHCNRDPLSRLCENKSAPVVSHHIKFDKESPLSYCDIVYDSTLQQCSLLLKVGKTEKFEGATKRATKQIALQIDSHGCLQLCPVVSYKGTEQSSKRSNHGDTIRETTLQGAVAFTCVSGSDTQGNSLQNFNRLGKDRSVDMYKGVTVSAAVRSAIRSDTGPATVAYNPHLIDKTLPAICHYMIQVGSQLSNFHSQGGTHADVKLPNILVQNRGREGKETPIYRVIDYPTTIKNPAILMPWHQLLSDLAFTPGVSVPYTQKTASSTYPISLSEGLANMGLPPEVVEGFEKINQQCSELHPNFRLCGHALDSYAFLYGLGQQIVYSVKNPLKKAPSTSTSELEKHPFYPFLVAKMTELQHTILTNTFLTNTFPDDLTVGGIATAFKSFVASLGTKYRFNCQKAIRAAEKIPADQISSSQNLHDLFIKAAPYGPPLLTAQQALQRTVTDNIVLGFWATIFDWLASFQSNAMTRKKAKDTLISYCKQGDLSHSSPLRDSLTQVLTAAQFLLKKNMLKTHAAHAQLVELCDSLKSQLHYIQPVSPPGKTHPHAAFSSNLKESLCSNPSSTSSKHSTAPSTKTKSDDFPSPPGSSSNLSGPPIFD